MTPWRKGDTCGTSSLEQIQCFGTPEDYRTALEALWDGGQLGRYPVWLEAMWFQDHGFG
ncbi:MAG: hypothetical protein HOB12_06395 [Gemmatimonadales bacterium]|nr:hypothetical protein [Gemmatimonadales bacterium]